MIDRHNLAALPVTVNLKLPGTEAPVWRDIGPERLPRGECYRLSSDDYETAGNETGRCGSRKSSSYRHGRKMIPWLATAFKAKEGVHFVD